MIYLVAQKGLDLNVYKLYLFSSVSEEIKIIFVFLSFQNVPKFHFWVTGKLNIYI